MPRIRLRDFSRGLWLNGPREDNPPGTLRRAKSLHAIRTPSIRSRNGSSILTTLPGAAHSLGRFATSRYAGVATDLYRDGVLLSSGLSGERLAFARMPPTVDQVDSLFVAGGGSPGLKISAGGAVTQWGIEPPSDSATAMIINPFVTTIDTFDNEAASFTLTSGSDTGNSNKSDESFITVSGGSLQIGVDRSSSVAYERLFGASLDLANFGGTPSPDEDYIEIWIHLGNPSRIEQVTLAFFAGSTDGNDMYTRDIQVEDTVSKKQIHRFRGLGDLVPVSGQDADFMAAQHPKPEQLRNAEQLGTAKLVATRRTWTKVQLPKSTFHRSGANGATWSDIRGIRVGVRTNNTVKVGAKTNVYFDECGLIGSVGMQGDYSWRFTFRNAVGSRSNPNAHELRAIGLFRNGVQLDNLPISTDPQVTDLEIWRTLGNGAVWFLADTVPNGTTSYVDEVADYIGMHADALKYLQDERLPEDNIYPVSKAVSPLFGAFETGALDAVGPHYGRMFWARDGGAGSGRVYYSEAGRAEGVQGFIEVTSTDDQTQKLIRWNDVLFCFCSSGVFQILGTAEPFIAQRVLGIPGTTAPYTVRACGPYGVGYQAKDGLRLFNGVTSDVLGGEAIATLMRGEDIEGLLTFIGLVAEYGNDAYIVSDGVNTTLSWNIADSSWREIGLAATALLFEDDTGFLTLARTIGQVLRLDDPGAVMDGNGPVPFLIQTGSTSLASGQRGMMQFLFIEANTGDQVLTPTLLVDAFEVPLPPFRTTQQSVTEWALAKVGRIWGVRIEGLLEARVEIVSVEADVYGAGVIE